MAYIYSEFVTLSAIMFVLLLHISSSFSSLVSSSGTSLVSISKSDLGKEKSNEVKASCSSNEDCSDYDAHCFLGYCHSCETDTSSGGCGDSRNMGEAIALSISVVIGLSLLFVTLLIVACFFFCAECPGHRCRQRRIKQQPPQVVVVANLGYDQHGNVTQYQDGPPPVIVSPSFNNVASPDPK